MGLQTLSCLLVLAFLVPAALAQSTCESEEPCVANCTGCTPYDKVPYPEDCHGYYRCEDGDAAENYFDAVFYCDDGEVFNVTDHECSSEGSCQICEATSSCVYECPDEGTTTDPVTIPIFEDCSIYYTCSGDGEGTLKTCDDPEKPFFDGKDCQADETRCCHCHPYCSTEDAPGFIADPLDCGRLYFCEEAGTVPTESASCPDGEYFSSLVGGCSETAPCNTQCTNVVGADGCIEPFTCLETGYFAKCPLAEECTPDYYHCTGATGTFQEAESCTGDGYVFSPDRHNCVSNDTCP